MTPWTQASVILGGIVWLGLFVTPLSGGGELGTIARVLLLAVLVLTPLGLSLTATPDRSGRHPLAYRAAQLTQPFAAALVLISFFLPTGSTAVLFASGWLICTGLAALFGLIRFLPRKFARADETCIDAGLIYLPVGGVWLVLSRLGANPLGFDDTIVLLTAVHFHYAGFAAPIIAGMAGRALATIKPSAWNAFRLVTIGVVAGPPLVAVGITFSSAIEVAAALILAGSLVLLSVLLLAVIVPQTHSRISQALLFISGGSLAVAMLAAALYAVSELAGTPLVSIPQMVVIHGWVNALGFVLCGLLAWTIVRPESKLQPRG